MDITKTCDFLTQNELISLLPLSINEYNSSLYFIISLTILLPSS